MLIFHYEPENASADAASETVKGLALRIDVERRSFFLMKGTERFEICAGPFQREVRPDHFDDVVRSRDLLYGF